MKKLDPRGRLASFVGYSERSKAFKLIDAESRKIVGTPNVQFNEIETVDMDFQTKSWGIDSRSDGEETVGLDFNDGVGGTVSLAECDMEQGHANTDHSPNSTAESAGVMDTIRRSSAISQQPVCGSNWEYCPPGEWWKA